MTDSLDAAATSLIATVNDISDPVERYQAATELRVRLDHDIKQIKADCARELYNDRSWGEVGGLLGVSGSRAEQISRAAR